MKGVSIVVCCYNSVVRLPETIKHLALQNVAHETCWEVVVIDNASTDRTAEIARGEWQRYQVDIPFHVYIEKTPGLSAARKRGVQEARYEYIIFCDDDNWLRSDYVQNAFRLLDADTSLGAVGGHSTGVYEKQRPVWMDTYEVSYAIGRQGKDPMSIIEGDGYLTGAGLAFRKSVYLQIFNFGFEQFLTDRIGKKLVSGGDVELCYLFRILGFRLLYTNQLSLSHFMPEGRMTKKYLTKMRHNYPESFLVFEAYRIELKNLPEKFYESPAYWTKSFLVRLVFMLRGIPKYLYAKTTGDIQIYLMWETRFLYNAYGLFHGRKLAACVCLLRKFRLKHLQAYR